MHHQSHVFALAFTLAAATTAFSADPPGKVAIDLSSPEKAFATWQKAVETSDMETLYAIQTPATIDHALFELYFTSYFLRSKGENSSPEEKKTLTIVDRYFDETKMKELSAKVDGNRLTDEERVKLVLSCIKDRKKLYVEGYQALEAGKKDNSTFTPLRNVKTQGEMARGTTNQTVILTSYERSKDGVEKTNRDAVTLQQPIYFVKTDGKWRIATELECQPLAQASKPVGPLFGPPIGPE